MKLSYLFNLKDQLKEKDETIEKLYLVIEKESEEHKKKLREERERIDSLCKSIESKFNKYIKDLEDSCIGILIKKPVIQVREIDEHNPMKFEIIKYGEIYINPFNIRFIKGVEEENGIQNK